MHYLGLYTNYLSISSPKSDGMTAVHCPFHEDSGKSAAVNLENGVFTCRSCNISYSAARFVSKHDNVSLQEAAVLVDTYRKQNKIVVNENNFSKKYVFALEKNEWRELYLASKRNQLEGTFAEEYCKEKGFSLEALKFCDCGFLNSEEIPEPSKQSKADWSQGAITFPYFYNGKIVGLRFRSVDGGKSGLKGSIAVPWGIDNLTNDDNFVVVVEGESDRLLLVSEMIRKGIDIKVVSLPGAFLSNEWERDFSELGTIFFIPDTDETGNKFASDFKSRYPNSVVVHKLIWKRRQLGKDLSEWAAQNDINEVLGEILDTYEKRKTRSGVLNTSTFLDSNDDDEQQEVIINKLLYEGQIGVLGGRQKSKKTWSLLNLVRCVLTPGSCFLGLRELTSTEKVPNILYVQTEGSKRKFKDRIKMVLSDCKNADKAYWWFKPGIKLDNDSDVDKLIKKLEQNKIGLLILDPFQRLHSKNEDSATDTAPVWDSLFRITHKIPNISIAIAHHFGKDTTIREKWEALRGSSRMGGEVDWGIFQEPQSKKEGNGIRVSFEFRDEEPLEDNEGKDVFMISFNPENGILTHDESTAGIDKSSDLEKWVREKGGSVTKEEACTHFGKSAPTINKWVERSENLTTTKPGPNTPAKIVLKEGKR